MEQGVPIGLLRQHLSQCPDLGRCASYLSTGAIYDPATRTQSGAFRTRGQGLALDTTRNKAHFASGEFATPLTFREFRSHAA